ncbi:NADPH HC-toxin reductase 1-like [Humulus lupulus]|uniref:NADPH HC-toxin reductase 1-like n=1 Tax=Humulus lupulus TaxID=3486 RepID=UPI002B404A7E|nr:NADPH HC-toxin reductase 1-like [Humulus lupulus]
MEKQIQNGCKVCVTGGAGYIASWLINKLLHRGYTVQATLRNLDDDSKVGLLKSFPGAETRLALFKADIYSPAEFDNAIQGCHYVFHVATPLSHTDPSQYKNTSEACVAAAKSVAMCCVRSGTVKRLIYTASVVAASPLKEDGTGFKDLMDETCWSTFNFSTPYTNDHLEAYLYSKTMAEKELLSLGLNGDGGKMEVVTLACGLVGGDTVLPYTPLTMALFISQLTNNETHYKTLKYLEELLGKVPVVHIDDVCEAHIFCMETPHSLHGRFLCATSYISSAQIATYYQQNYPQLHVNKKYLEGPDRTIELDSSKLIEKGFIYKYNTDMILDGCISCATRMGDLI